MENFLSYVIWPIKIRWNDFVENSYQVNGAHVGVQIMKYKKDKLKHKLKPVPKVFRKFTFLNFSQV